MSAPKYLDNPHASSHVEIDFTDVDAVAKAAILLAKDPPIEAVFVPSITNRVFAMAVSSIVSQASAPACVISEGLRSLNVNRDLDTLRSYVLDAEAELIASRDSIESIRRHMVVITPLLQRAIETTKLYFRAVLDLIGIWERSGVQIYEVLVDEASVPFSRTKVANSISNLREEQTEILAVLFAVVCGDNRARPL